MFKIFILIQYTNNANITSQAVDQVSLFISDYFKRDRFNYYYWLIQVTSIRQLSLRGLLDSPFFNMNIIDNNVFPCIK